MCGLLYTVIKLYHIYTFTDTKNPNEYMLKTLYKHIFAILLIKTIFNHLELAKIASSIFCRLCKKSKCYEERECYLGGERNFYQETDSLLSWLLYRTNSPSFSWALWAWNYRNFLDCDVPKKFFFSFGLWFLAKFF